VTNKARFIAQILDDESPARVSEDMDERVLTYAEIQAIASGNPDIKERIETENRLAELYALRRDWGAEKARMRECLDTFPAMLEKAQDTLTKIQADMPNAKKVTEMEELPFSNERIHGEIRRAIANLKNGKDESIVIGKVAGFEVSVKAEEVSKCLSLENYSIETVAKITVKGESEYWSEAGLDESQNNMVRLKNIFANIVPKREETFKNDVAQLSSNIEQAKNQIHVPFEYDEEVSRLERRFEELNEKLSGITEQEDVTADPEDVDFVETAEEKVEREKLYSADDNDYQAVENDERDNTPDKDTPEPPQKGKNGRLR
jgi:hypothetical protein